MPTTVHTLRVEPGISLTLDWHSPSNYSHNGPAAVFVHGLGSHRRGEKALHFAEQFNRQGWGFLAPDLRGHGDSGGTMSSLTLSGMLADIAASLSWLGERAQVRLLIGSSMGAAVAAWHQVLSPQPQYPLVLIAPALTFPRRFLEMSRLDLDDWKAKGKRHFYSEWLDLELGYNLIEDGLQYNPDHLLLTHSAPTLIFHGMQDNSVSWRGSLEFAERCPAQQIDLLVIKSGDHRLTNQKNFLFEATWSWLQQLNQLGRV
jgi:uncharacterized protein